MLQLVIILRVMVDFFSSPQRRNCYFKNLYFCNILGLTTLFSNIIDFKCAKSGFFFIICNNSIYYSNSPEYGKSLNAPISITGEIGDIQKKTIVFPHCFYAPTHFTNISVVSNSPVYAMELYYDGIIFLTERNVTAPIPMHLSLKHEKIKEQIFPAPPPSIDCALCPCKQIFENPTTINYEPLGKQILHNLQINLESVGLYKKYKDALLFLSKLKSLSYDLETTFISFSDKKYAYGKKKDPECASALLSKFEILASGISSYISINKMLEFINIFIPNYLVRYRKSKNRMGWSYIEKLISAKYKLSQTSYNKSIEQIISHEYIPTVYIPKTHDEFFNILVSLGRLIELLHFIILYPLLTNLQQLKSGINSGGIFSIISNDLISWSKNSLIFAFNGASFDNICKIIFDKSKSTMKTNI